MLLIQSLIFFTTLFSAAAQYVIIGEPVDVVIDKGHAAVHHGSNKATRSLTNGERMQQGLAPAYPKPLLGVMGARARKDQGRAVHHDRRAPACGSGAPIAFPSHTAQQTDPLILYSGQNGKVDDSEIPITLMFNVNLFGVMTPTVHVSVNGLISTAGYAGFGPHTLYSNDVGSAAIFPFFADLYVSEGSLITVAASDTDFSIRWQVTTFEKQNDPGNVYDFTVYYTTATPGRWYTYYDKVFAEVSTIGAQGAPGSNLFTQFGANNPNAVSAGTKLAFDTACGGSTTSG